MSTYALRLGRQAGRDKSRPHGAPPMPISGPIAQGALQRVGVVRFNPYHDTGGEFSFAVALLDAQGSGLLLTGLYHRDQTRVYAKQVSAWTSEQELMDEESEAIARARGDITQAR